MPTAPATDSAAAAVVHGMISPTESLAFSMHANPGVYAVLAGSGLSRAARIPTGWEITLDLVRKLAALRNEQCAPDPEGWYRTTFREDPNYSDLLDKLCKTPAERQQLLRSYIEPRADDREEGARKPTAAHRALASLAAGGFIRVILTTNFDRLIETALDEKGVTPTVLSTPDQVQGALPLVHTRCCVVKLHGDYLDTRIRNTEKELDSYSEEFDRLLDRVFDEFGLVVCGWSAAWDGALRKALCRAQSRRFSMYWAVHGEIEDEAQRLIKHRSAEMIPINDADDFLDTVQQHVESLRQLQRPHPLSTEAAVASLKRYLPDSRHRIRLSDLVEGVVEQVISATSGDEFSVDRPEPDGTTVTARVRAYEAASATLLALAPVGGYWAEEEHVSLWQRALRRLGATQTSGGRPYPLWEQLKRYPATLLFYALGIGAVEADRLRFLGRLLEAPMREQRGADEAAVQVLPPSVLVQGRKRMQMLKGMGKRLLPLNDWMHDALRRHTARIIPDAGRYTFVFDKLEILLALGYLARRDDGSHLIGAFAYRSDNRDRLMREIQESLSTRGDDSPFVSCDIFGDTADVCGQRVEKLRAFVENAYRW